MRWDPPFYDWQTEVPVAGPSLVELLNPQPGERVLDISCRTGRLTAALADRGAAAKGICGDPGKIEKARSAYPNVEFGATNIYEFATDEPYDAAFSFAAWHWLPRPADALVVVHRALRPGGRFVVEMGVAGNWAALIEGLQVAADKLGLPDPVLPWQQPTPAAQAAFLESAGFRVRLMEYVDRPAPLADGATGVSDWWRTIGAPVLRTYPPDRVDELLAEATAFSRDALTRPDGTWFADGARLRFRAEAI
ncbi:class I SAM-dependent methyltransferase [Saccharopolyspora sp. 5N708]|uniref:class I SAM-dependent methyltransferase n=1 Tax=Saccharopolyspora sp. 5N708 TaxID=3457424 RepID=UPI003FCF61EF